MRYCSATTTCRNLVVKGRCPAHQRDHERRRGSRHQRGYDHDWETLREQFLEQSYPWFCAIEGSHCTAKRRLMERREIDVDHVIPFRGASDALRLDINNLRCCCRACHREKTRTQHRGDV